MATNSLISGYHAHSNEVNPPTSCFCSFWLQIWMFSCWMTYPDSPHRRMITVGEMLVTMVEMPAHQTWTTCPKAKTPSCCTAITVVVSLGSKSMHCIGLASDGATKHSNPWQREKLVLNKVSAPYKSMLGEKSLTGRTSLFLSGEVWTVLTTPSQLSASHFKRYQGSDKCRGPFFGRQTISQHAFVWDAVFV